MTVTLQLPGVLAGYAGGRREIEIAVPDAEAGDGAATTVARVLDRLAGDLPALERRIRDERSVIRRHVNVYVDGADIRSLSGAETRIADGATIDVIPAISGG
ncbi:MAG TPA: MoaD/ThiS family protein [Actinocrinis sp.]|uniref:MoaD/ThiS family protein n=1 Tax=Actinocrinis sp. TaxID=1920516 RepID=UPI002DDCF67D|nr:MoaD/ThiS family protein [Actinocrinis sp.]HEV2344740.1 MoaD/ThiS family protein [Actinocrinis sp.]